VVPARERSNLRCFRLCVPDEKGPPGSWGSRWAFPVNVPRKWLRLIELIAIPTSNACLQGQTAMKSATKSLEGCLQEAAECERLADLARLESSRRILALSASYWRRLAEGGRAGPPLFALACCT
jgi:hypothetical protein